MKKTYYTTVAGHILGAHREKGEACGELSNRQAKYLVMSGLITDVAPKQTERPAKPEPDAATLERKTR